MPYLQKITRYGEWAQDWGEFAAVRVDGDEKWFYGFLDVGQTHYDPNEIGKKFNIPILRIATSKLEDITGGNYGGNLEATPEGVLYFGSTLQDQTMINHLRNAGNSNAITIPTSWLKVGHVDEYTTFIPSSNNECGFTLVVASPLEALNILISLSQKERESFGIEFILNDAVLSLLKDRKKNPPYNLNDFIATQPIEAEKPSIGGMRWIDPDVPLKEQEYKKDLKWARYTVLANLDAEKHIQEGIAVFGKNIRCLKDIVTLPQMFSRPVNDLRYSAMYANSVNMVVLRDHVIVPLPKDLKSPPIEPFRSRISEKLASRLGGKNKVHFLDTDSLQEGEGDIHCNVNIIRELNMPFNIK